ncbi:MAG TPA: hypothetical protein VFL84_03750 [Gammaproteobacteria bacterium]|nr:hypothetical protein [Gammaproteobacteria bacterium]HWC45304.1 hypothetical protein [Casimicrobiaceae bacterium]
MFVAILTARLASVYPPKESYIDVTTENDLKGRRRVRTARSAAATAAEGATAGRDMCEQ